MSDTRRQWLAAAGLATVSGAAGLGLGAWLSRRRGAQPAGPRAVPALPRALPTGQRPLNVLLVVTDQERADVPAGLPRPGLDRLREQGCTLENWHVNTSPCSPSRATLYFGQHPQRTGMVANLGHFPEPELPSDLPSLGHFFRANGYITAYKGKWQLSPVPGRFDLSAGRYPNARDLLEPFGFGDFNTSGDIHGGAWAGYRHDPAIAADAAHWLLTRGRRSTQPWLLAVNFVNPQDVGFLATSAAQIASRAHPDLFSPLAGPPLDPLYQTLWDAPLPASRTDDLARKPWAHRQFRAWCDTVYGQLDGDAAWRALLNHYLNSLRDVDRHLLTVLNALEASGQAGRTVVVYTSDHGEMGGAHGLRHSGPFMYQENTRVPFVVRHPDVRGPRRSEALGSTVDLIPTLLELAGGEPSQVAKAYPALPGVSVARALADTRHRGERDARGILFSFGGAHTYDPAYAEALARQHVDPDRLLPVRAVLAGLPPWPRRDQPTLARGIHTGTHKFARYFKPAEHHRPLSWETLIQHNTLELVDVRRDPREQDNLAHAPEWNRALVTELNERLDRLIAREVGSDLGDELPGPSFLKRL